MAKHGRLDTGRGPSHGRIVGGSRAGLTEGLLGPLLLGHILDRIQRIRHDPRMSPDFRQQLRSANLRVTRPRVAVLTAVHAHPHSDTETVIGAVRAELPAVSHQTGTTRCTP